jgi:hypothetical protein
MKDERCALLEGFQPPTARLASRLQLPALWKSLSLAPVQVHVRVGTYITGAAARIKPSSVQCWARVYMAGFSCKSLAFARAKPGKNCRRWRKALDPGNTASRGSGFIGLVARVAGRWRGSENSKSEFRNPKQIQSKENGRTCEKTGPAAGDRNFWVSCLFRISNFEIRISGARPRRR